jgi:hypothetical protein
MLAYLWQERPELLPEWFRHLGISVDGAALDVTTQFVLPSKRRPDILISSTDLNVLVESKLGAGFGESQIDDYLGYLEDLDGRGALVLLTQRPESPPVALRLRADKAGVTLIATRWQDMTASIAEPGEESLAGDFVQLLTREGLVKPDPFSHDDWIAWNSGFQVLLRVSSLLDELEPIVKQLDPSISKTSTGLTKGWIYRVWRGDAQELGLGLGPAAEESTPRTKPVIFAFVGSPSASYEDAMAAVGVTKATQYQWNERPDLGEGATCGLMYSWPSISRHAEDVLTADTFEGQLSQAAEFLKTTARYFQSRAYLPADPAL